jgi:carbon storage regulator CsrA
MLVLSRRTGEQLVIGEGITITILKVCGEQIRIGIEAPPAIQIRRGELPPRSHVPPVPRPPRPRRTDKRGPSTRFSTMKLPTPSKLPAVVIDASNRIRPLAAKLLARRVPSASCTPLMN